jgi:hypothetical protein
MCCIPTVLPPCRLTGTCLLGAWVDARTHSCCMSTGQGHGTLACSGTGSPCRYGAGPLLKLSCSAVSARITTNHPGPRPHTCTVHSHSVFGLSLARGHCKGCTQWTLVSRCSRPSPDQLPLHHHRPLRTASQPAWPSTTLRLTALGTDAHLETAKQFAATTQRSSVRDDNRHCTTLASGQRVPMDKAGGWGGAALLLG